MFNPITNQLLLEIFTQNKNILLVVATSSDTTKEITIQQKDVNLYEEHLTHFDGSQSNQIFYKDIVLALPENKISNV